MTSKRAPGAGRKPKPTAIKKLTGNPGKRALPKHEPKADVALPKPPNHLDARAKKYYKEMGGQLVAMRVMTTADRDALALLAQTYSDWVRAKQDLDKYGMTMEQRDRSGRLTVVTNPAWRIANAAAKNYHRLLIEFGLTPSSRTRIEAFEPAAEVSSLTAILNRRKQT